MSDPREESWAASPEDEKSPIEAAENPDAKSPEPETAEPAAPEQEAEAAAPAEDIGGEVRRERIICAAVVAPVEIGLHQLLRDRAEVGGCVLSVDKGLQYQD